MRQSSVVKKILRKERSQVIISAVVNGLKIDPTLKIIKIWWEF